MVQLWCEWGISSLVSFYWKQLSGYCPSKHLKLLLIRWREGPLEGKGGGVGGWVVWEMEESFFYVCFNYYFFSFCPNPQPPPPPPLFQSHFTIIHPQSKFFILILYYYHDCLSFCSFNKLVFTQGNCRETHM